MSYLNTLPLVWGFLNGPQRGQAAISFYPPSECALRVGQGAVDAGLIPVVEAARQGLQIIADVGIACRGAVRSILLVSKVDFGKIRRLAVDRYSRSSVLLCRVILRELYAADPELVPMEPALDPMLAAADACLIIGDPALRLEPESLAYHTLDLGSAWWRMTHLPMVFAAWAGRKALPSVDFHASFGYGFTRMEEYLRAEAAERSIGVEAARDYLLHRIVYELGRDERRGLAEYLRLAGTLEEVGA